MHPLTEIGQTCRRLARAARGAWFPLACWELAISLLWAAALGPLLLALSYQAIELSGDSVLGNVELARFLGSPIGVAALVLGASLSLGLIWMELAVLILWGSAAQRGAPMTSRQAAAAMLGAAPRLFGLAAAQTCALLLVALPLLVLGAGLYWVLLGGTDINFYLAERPPKFWFAAAAGAVLAVLFIVIAAGLFSRWALALPACMVDGHGWMAALAASSRLMRGRRWRLILLVAAWLAIKYLLLLGTLWVLDAANERLLSWLPGELPALIWVTLAALIVDAGIVQVVGALFAIGIALLLVDEYQQALARHEQSPGFGRGPAFQQATPVPGWRGWLMLGLLAVAGPAASLTYALAVAPELVERRPALVTAHRAGPKPAPENSLAALRLALAAGADFVELDVQPTADGQVVLAHDRDLRRVTGDPRVVTELRLDEIAALRLREGSAPGREPIPTLEQFLAACDGQIRLNVEMKDFGNAGGLALAVLDVLRRHDFTDRAVVSCFQLAPLRELKKAEPRLPVGKIVSASQGDLTRLPVDFLSVHQRLVRGGLVGRAHRRGMQVHVWTVNDRETVLRMLDHGCDNLITSRPEMVREIVDEYAQLGNVERMVLRVRRWLRE